MDHKKKIKANLKPGKGNKIQFYKNGKPLGVAFEDINDGVYYPAVSLFKSAKVMTSIVHGRIDLLTSLDPRVKIFRGDVEFSTDFHGHNQKTFFRVKGLLSDISQIFSDSSKLRAKMEETS